MSCTQFFTPCSTKLIQTKKRCKIQDQGNRCNIYLESKNDINFEIINFDKCSCPRSHPQQTSRCDYIVTANNKMYFIELKGGDISKAIAQIVTSVKIIKPKVFACYIAKTGKGHPSFKTNLQVAAAKIKQEIKLVSSDFNISV